MRILSLVVTRIQRSLFDANQKTFTFAENANIIFSKENSVGKTTLLRLLMHAFGYTIPNTRGIKFSDYKTVLTLISSNSEHYTLTRIGNHIDLLHNGVETGYSLPVEQNAVHAIVFGISNTDIVENLLGTFYLDQEKGWILLNRGKVIGNIHFSIEALLRGLSGKTNDALSQRLSVVKREIKKYKHMLDIAEYKAEINQLGECVYQDSPADDIESALEALYCERKPLEDELNRIKSVVKKNTAFERYITSFSLRVRSTSGEEIPVNKDTIVNYGDTRDLLAAKQMIITEQLTTIDNRINRLKNQQEHENTLLDVKTAIELFDEEISRMRIDAVTTQRIINKLDNERILLEKDVIACVKKDNPLVPELHRLILGYATRIGLDGTYISERTDYIFTNDIKSLSGAIFHEVVFAFKMAYIKLIRKHTGVLLPIILDSPSGREVNPANIAEMMAILADDFSDHQIIIASIYDNYNLPNKTIIEITDRLLSF